MQYVEPVYSVWYNIWELQQTSYTNGLLLFCTNWDLAFYCICIADKSGRIYTLNVC